MAIRLQDTTERFFNELRRILDIYLDGEITMFSVDDRLRELETEYSQFQVIVGLNKIGFNTFTEQEQICMLLMVQNVYLNGITPTDFGNYSYSDEYKKICEGKNSLLDRGLVRLAVQDTANPERYAGRKEQIILTPDTCGKIFYGMKNIISYEKVAKHTEVIKASTIDVKELYFENDNLNDIEKLYKIISADNYKNVIDRLKAMKRRTSISCLFYGSPGTGKTELAKQLARESGRDILIADISKLHSSFTGDTEKNYRELFLGYRYLEKISENAPILLFNEADGIISKRGDVIRQAIDKIANRIQNILLQELEDFEGIFIATTNLAQNIDQAFERRLLFKIEFKKPGVEVRKKIWKNMIPWLDNYQIYSLSTQYKFSGGQIENIATRQEIDYVIDGAFPSFAKILEYCNLEAFNKQSSNTVGYMSGCSMSVNETLH